MSGKAGRGRRSRRSARTGQKARLSSPDPATGSSLPQPQLIDNPGLATTSANGPAAGGSSAVPDLVARINDGEFDQDLYLLSRALRVRWEAVEAARVVRAMVSLQLGDLVRIKEEVKTRRHRGLIGKVVERHDNAVVICLGDNVADADHRHIRCSPLAVDKLPSRT